MIEQTTIPQSTAEQFARPTAAVWTAPGRGAVASIRIQDPVSQLAHRVDGLLQFARNIAWRDLPMNHVCFGRWGEDAAEEVVVCRVGDSVTELHCHGGRAAVQRILDDLRGIGCETVDWDVQQQTNTSRLASDQQVALSRATTLRTAAWVMSQAGRLEREVEDMRSRLSGGDWFGIERSLGELLQWADFGVHLTEPWSVVIAGRPNVGKSSLVNSLAGFERVIVFDQPGTTRDVVSIETVFDGWPVRLSDTAGLRDTLDHLEAAGIQKARQELSHADLRILLLDVGQPPQATDWRLIAENPDALVIAHKCDLPNVWGSELPAGVLPVSSLTGRGVAELAETITRRLVPTLPPNTTVLPLSQRQVAALREARIALAERDLTMLAGVLAKLCQP